MAKTTDDRCRACLNRTTVRVQGIKRDYCWDTHQFLRLNKEGRYIRSKICRMPKETNNGNLNRK